MIIFFFVFKVVSSILELQIHMQLINTRVLVLMKNINDNALALNIPRKIMQMNYAFF